MLLSGRRRRREGVVLRPAGTFSAIVFTTNSANEPHNEYQPRPHGWSPSAYARHNGLLRSKVLQLLPRRAMLACVGHPSKEASMIRLIAAAVLVLTAAVPAIACEWNQSAAADTRAKTTTSQAGTAQ